MKRPATPSIGVAGRIGAMTPMRRSCSVFVLRLLHDFADSSACVPAGFVVFIGRFF